MDPQELSQDTFNRTIDLLRACARQVSESGAAKLQQMEEKYRKAHKNALEIEEQYSKSDEPNADVIIALARHQVRELHRTFQQIEEKLHERQHQALAQAATPRPR